MGAGYVAGMVRPDLGVVVELSDRHHHDFGLEV